MAITIFLRLRHHTPGDHLPDIAAGESVCTGGAITTFDVSGASETIPVAINTSGTITGSFAIPPFEPGHSFVRNAGGVITTFDVPGALETIAFDINDAGQTTGVFTTPAPNGGVADHGFVRNAVGAITTFDVPGGFDTSALGINNLGEIAGDFFDASGHVHGFLRDVAGGFTTFDVPDAFRLFDSPISTFGRHIINDSDQIAGAFVTSLNAIDSHGFLATLTVPEPGGIPLFATGLGVVAAGLLRRRRQSHHAS